MPYTPAQDLAGKHPLDTRTLLVTTDGSQLFMGDGNLITTLNISSITSSVVTESIVQSSIITASTAVRVGAFADEFAHLYVSGSPGLTIAEFDNSAGSEVFKITAAGYTIIQSGSFTGSLQGTSSRAVSSSHAGSSSHAVVATYTDVSAQAAGQYNVALLGSNSGYANVYADSNSDMLYNVSTNTLTVPFTFTTASYAGTASYVSASAIAGGVTNQFHFISQSFTTMSFVNGILTSFV